MKIQCDVCESAPATVICCADEAALCANCDIQVHAANKLASKHQRLHLNCLSNKLPFCDICQEKAAFIFCVEDRALFCKDCDEQIHSANSRAANHQRYLATGIRVAMISNCNKDEQIKPQVEPKPPKQTQVLSSNFAANLGSPSWVMDDLLKFSDDENSDKKEQLEFGGIDWFSDIGLFGEQFCQEAEVPQIRLPGSQQTTNIMMYKPAKLYTPNKKPRIEMPDDDDEHFTVPDLG
ncbi:hypothetical protein Leryth_010518 [Lithospermum erythrorhizon]|uniref:B box-type domain-containing protein n=1 Tax=Lithospermum erythrorhizon TaxID=34254 RepID=A0AAV3REY0_LITER|nr:hypothetical protein Leryth_010518 [Lithospermum erythrorhizon]